MHSSSMITVTLLLALACAKGVQSAGCNKWCGLQGKDCDAGLRCGDNICVGDPCAGARGDPELRGLDGRKFFFTGEPDKVFNFISEQVNARFVEGPHIMAGHGSDAKNGTFIGAMGLKLHNTTIEVSVNEDGEMKVLVNDEAVNLTAANQYQETMNFPKVSFAAHKYRTSMGESVHMVTDLYNLLVYATPKQWEEDSQQVERGHLNLAMAVEPRLYLHSDVHGVLGQIKPNPVNDHSLLPEELQTAFLGEGSEMQYEVSGLFADDFKYNRFNVTGAVSPASVRQAKALQVVASRRRLHEREPFHSGEWVDIIKGISYQN